MLAGNWQIVLLYYVAFFSIDLLTALLAYGLEGENPSDLVLFFPQRLYYRALMNYVLAKSFVFALRGRLVGWGKLERLPAYRTPHRSSNATGAKPVDAAVVSICHVSPETPSMDLAAWNLRYRSGERASEDVEAPPTKLLMDTAARSEPTAGKALNFACGTGRNALWLAKRGWQVTAVDGADSAIEMLRHRAAEDDVDIDARVADLEKGDYRVEPASWLLIAICYYLQRDLLEPAKRGLVPGGVLVCIVHIAQNNEGPTATR